MAKWIKRLVIATLCIGVAMVSLYYYLLIYYEDRLFISDTVITDVFPGSEVSATLSAGGRSRNKEGIIVWGNPYDIDVDVFSETLSKGSIKITGITLTETGTGKVIYQTDTTFIRKFKWDDYYDLSRVRVFTPKFNIPYTDCTLHFDLVASGPWGTADAQIAIPFKRKFNAYQEFLLLGLLKL